MYLWNINKLIDDLRSDEVSEWECAKYLILILVVFGFTTDPIFILGTEYSRNDFLITCITVLAGAIGTYLCYRNNSSGDNRDFIRRYICMSVPIGIRMLPVIVLLGVISGLIFTENWPGLDEIDTPVSEPPEPYVTPTEDVGFYAIFELIFYSYLIYAFSKVSRITPVQEDA